MHVKLAGRLLSLARLSRRLLMAALQYSHDGDSCGIHSSGAGFDRVDKIEHWVPPTF